MVVVHVLLDNLKFHSEKNKALSIANLFYLSVCLMDDKKTFENKCMIKKTFHLCSLNKESLITVMPQRCVGENSFLLLLLSFLLLLPAFLVLLYLLETAEAPADHAASPPGLHLQSQSVRSEDGCSE